MIEDVEAARKHSARHRGEIAASTVCGCFYCQSIFQANEIRDWVNDGQSALCPRCGINSVIGDASGFPLSPVFLAKMNQRWFQRFQKIKRER
jgi:uncharacterized paraquat-inducible protein A